MKKLKFSVQDFAQPSPLSGSLRTCGFLVKGQLQTGIELHQRRQRVIRRNHPEAEIEKKIKLKFELDDYLLIIEGRMDVFIPGIVPHIEEIKTTSLLSSLEDALKSDPFSHPYGLQLMTYAYGYLQQYGVIPNISFHLISSRSGITSSLSLGFDLDKYNGWLEQRLTEISEELSLTEKRIKRRRRLAEKLKFPFSYPRPGQQELIDEVNCSLNGKKRLLLQAPTGLGKTSGVLYPALKNSLPRGQQVIYITSKNSQQLVAMDAVERFHEIGCKLKSLVLTAKTKCCLKEEMLCSPEYCEFSRSYYDKLAKTPVLSKLRNKRNIKASTLRELGRRYEVCPYELQREALTDADVIIGDYNHVFSPHTSLSFNHWTREFMDGLPILVIDEAHNLAERAMSYFSPQLNLAKIRKTKERLPMKYSRTLSAAEGELLKHRHMREMEVSLEISPFQMIRDKLGEELASTAEQGDSLVELLQLYLQWNYFTDCLELSQGRPEFFATFDPKGEGVLSLTCSNAGKFIQDVYRQFEQVICFSATLKPFDYYQRLLGLEEDVSATEFQTPFNPERRKLMLIPQISTKFSHREHNYSRVAEVINRVVSEKLGNYIAFFPSFEFLERTIPFLQLPSLFLVRKQERSMKLSDVENILNEMRSNQYPIVLCAVQGGVFSEGVDYPGAMAIGAFVIGPPLPQFNLVRERMKQYYQEEFATGFEYAYSFPAMAKAVQAAGRIIRTETDAGVIVLMDNRFLEKNYFSVMPADWYKKSPGELVSQSILKDVQNFWSSISSD